MERTSSGRESLKRKKGFGYRGGCHLQGFEQRFEETRTALTPERERSDSFASERRGMSFD